AEAQSALLEKKTLKQCCTYGKCVATTCLTGCVATYVIKTINNIDLAQWICATGLGVACYQCNSTLKADKRARDEMREKIALLRSASRRQRDPEIQQTEAEDVVVPLSGRF
ncbi:MAG: hypothetical protein M1114_01480, partial [Candidatus Dependentiae bacterium]|nr:hypothetical protein [Candidatus Dependentiae bacterium]